MCVCVCVPLLYISVENLFFFKTENFCIYSIQIHKETCKLLKMWNTKTVIYKSDSLFLRKKNGFQLVKEYMMI